MNLPPFWSIWPSGRVLQEVSWNRRSSASMIRIRVELGLAGLAEPGERPFALRLGFHRLVDRRRDDAIPSAHGSHGKTVFPAHHQPVDPDLGPGSRRDRLLLPGSPVLANQLVPFRFGDGIPFDRDRSAAQVQDLEDRNRQGQQEIIRTDFGWFRYGSVVPQRRDPEEAGSAGRGREFDGPGFVFRLSDQARLAGRLPFPSSISTVALSAPSVPVTSVNTTAIRPGASASTPIETNVGATTSAQGLRPSEAPVACGWTDGREGAEGEEGQEHPLETTRLHRITPGKTRASPAEGKHPRRRCAGELRPRIRSRGDRCRAT